MNHGTSVQAEGVGEILRTNRLSLGHQLSDVAKFLRIAEKYLAALEAGDYYKIPSPTYARGFLERYAEFLNLDPTELLDLYYRESAFSEVKQRVISQQSVAQKRLFLFNNHKNKISIKPAPALHLLRPKKIKDNDLQKIVGAILSVGLVVYLAAVIAQPFFPPQMKIFSPTNNLTIDQKTILIKGWADNGAIVKINGQSVIKDNNNLFVEEVPLSQGLNIIRISAKKINSPENVILRQVFVK